MKACYHLQSTFPLHNCPFPPVTYLSSKHSIVHNMNVKFQRHIANALYCVGFNVLIAVHMVSAFFLPVIIIIPPSNLNSQMTVTNLLIPL